MTHFDQAVIVEGKYDKIKLSSVIDALIITTEGFGIYKDKEKAELIKNLSRTRGIIILTDSDKAGFRIRNYIKNITSGGKVYNVYIPDIFGKEKRKEAPSAEGKLGVEGIPAGIILEAFKKAGITGRAICRSEAFTRAKLYDDGFIGKDGSYEKRKRLLKALGLPERLSVSALLEVLNTTFTPGDYEKAAKSAIPSIDTL